MMKRLSALILALAMLLSLSACSLSDAVEVIEIAEEVVSVLEEAEAAPEETEAAPEELPDDAPEDAVLPNEEAPEPEETEVPTEAPIDEDGWFYSKEEVALYIHTYGHLPSNFITKSEARDLGWEGGSVEDYAPGRAIGGDVFGNREGLLPEADGRVYYECDIDTDGYHSRGSRRIVFSNDGLIYYTHDHYESFELLYGEE